MNRPDIIVLTAPSGSGKTTIARRLMQETPDLEFSVSATTRPTRPQERDGVDYYFISEDDFRGRIENGQFVEFVEVYPGIFYGTLYDEIERITRNGRALLDIDVKGALKVKDRFGDRVLTLFVRPPSIEALEERLRSRGTESEDSLRQRLDRAKVEMTYAPRFDRVIENTDLDHAVAAARQAISAA